MATLFGAISVDKETPEKLWPDYKLDLDSYGHAVFAHIEEGSPYHMWEDMCTALSNRFVGKVATVGMKALMSAQVKNWLVDLAYRRALYYSDHDKVWWYNGNAGRDVIK